MASSSSTHQAGALRLDEAGEQVQLAVVLLHGLGQFLRRHGKGELVDGHGGRHQHALQALQRFQLAGIAVFQELGDEHLTAPAQGAQRQAHGRGGLAFALSDIELNQVFHAGYASFAPANGRWLWLGGPGRAAAPSIPYPVRGRKAGAQRGAKGDAAC